MKTNIEIIQNFQEGIAKSNFEDAFNLISDNALWHSDEIGAPWSGIHKGKAEILKHFDAIKGTTKNFKRHHQQFIGQGDLVIEIGSLSCTLVKTGKPFDTDYICLYEIVGGRIASYRIFENSLKLYNAYFGENKDIHGLSFEKSVTTIENGDMAKVIKASDIAKHFPAKAPGAISIFKDDSMSVGMVQTVDHPSYPHRNDYDEVHYVIKGSGYFRHGDQKPIEVGAGDIVYVKHPELHEWFDTSKDFELIFIQSL